MSRRAVLLVTVLGTGCAAPHSAHAPPAPNPRLHDANPSLPLFVTDEVARFGTADHRVDHVATSSDGALYFATGRTVTALDGELQIGFRSELAGAVRGLLALGDGRVLAAVTIDRDTALALLDRDGRITATASFRQLIGKPCGPSTNEWLARDAGTITAIVSCGTQFHRVHVSLDLQRADPRAWTPGLAAAPRWSLDAAGGTTIAVRRDHETTVLARAPVKLSTLFAAPRIAALAEDDVVVASSVAYPARANHFASSAFVARLAGITRWRTELVPPHESPYPARIVDVATAGQRILVTLYYRTDARIGGTALPILPSTAAFPALAHRVALAELDRDRGDLARVTLLRTELQLSAMQPPRVSATDRHIFLHVDGNLVAFRRGGVALAAVGPRATEPSRGPPELAVPPVEPAQVAAIPAQWSELCTARVASRFQNSPCRVEHVAIGKRGVVAAAGGYYKANQLGARQLPARAFQGGVLAVYEPDGRMRWLKTLGTAWHNGIDAVLVRDDDRIVVLGVHGNHFAIDGVRLPDRDLRDVPGQDMGFEANTPYLAIFDPAGKLELVEDLDVLMLGTRSRSRDRTCRGELQRATAANQHWLLATCDLAGDAAAHRAPPRASFRLLVEGTTPHQPTRIASTRDLPDVYPWIIGETGHVFGAWHDSTRAELLAITGPRFSHTTLVSPRGSIFSVLNDLLAASPRRVWQGHVVEDQPTPHPESSRTTPLADPADSTSTSERRFVLASTDLELRAPLARTIAFSPTAILEAITVDDTGRPVLSILHDQPITIGGHTLAAPGRAFVRLAADGSRIDRILVARAGSGGCARATAGRLTSLAARGPSLAITVSLSADPACGLRDESSAVIVLAIPPHGSH